MKKPLSLSMALLCPLLVSSWAATSVTVNKSGSGDFTAIQPAIASGATLITITDNGHYVENLEIGNPDTGGPAVTLTSNQSGTNRPVITPSEAATYVTVQRQNQSPGIAVFANSSVISNLIIEAQPDFNTGGLMVMANDVRIENCLFRIAPDTVGTLSFFNSLLFFAQQGDGSGNLVPGVNPTPGGRNSNGSLVRNCEFSGVAPDADPVEPTGTGVDASGAPDGSLGYLAEKVNGQGHGQISGYCRTEHVTNGEDILITFEDCYFHHSRDYGIFPTNAREGAGSVTVAVKRCRFDANGKFHLRGRGANVIAESCVFSRSNQIRNGDGENSAIAIQTNHGHIPTGTVKNSLFVNCGSANAQKAYYAGVNNHNGGLLTVENCTFVHCLSGVSAGSGGGGRVSVSNSIFHQIGNNIPPAVNASGITLTNGSPELVGGVFQVWTNGLVNFGGDKWSAVFNRHVNNDALITLNNCLVGAIDSEDTRPWEDALASGEVLGGRLFNGLDDDFEGETTVTRGIPVFINTDPDAPNPFQLAPGSPGPELGADLASELGLKLTISRSGNTANISWTGPLWVKGYYLKSTPALISPVWTPVAGVANNSATVPIGTANQYFALLKD